MGINQNLENNIFEKDTEQQISEKFVQDDEILESVDSNVNAGSDMSLIEKSTSQTDVKSYQYSPWS